METSKAHNSVELLEKARAEPDAVLKELGSQLGGLSQAEADSRLKQVGMNEIAREKRQSVLVRLLGNVKNPLVLLLMALFSKSASFIFINIGFDFSDSSS